MRLEERLHVEHPGGGLVAGHVAQGIGIDLTLQATNAEMLNRDDLGAYVTGPITIRSDGNGGVIGTT